MNDFRQTRSPPLSRRALATALGMLLGSTGAHAMAATRSAPPPVPHGNTLAVTSCLDDGGNGTLRHVVATAGDGDTIDLSQLSCSTITLLTGAINFAGGDLTVIGPGQHALTIDGADHDRVFAHNGVGALAISDLAFAHGHIRHAGGASIKMLGGCLFASHDLLLARVTVDSCRIDGSADAQLVAGAAVAAYGNLTLTASTITHASAANALTIKGAAVFARYAATVTDSVISDSTGVASGHGYGGCLYLTVASLGSTAQASITHSRFSDCVLTATGTGGHAAKGGGVFAGFDLDMTTSVVTGNTAVAELSYGGGLFIGRHAQIETSTVSANQASAASNAHAYGGGIAGGDSTTIVACTLERNAGDIGGAVHALGNSLTVLASTISGNSASYGCGGIYAGTPLSLLSSTIAFNTSGIVGGGICPHGGLLASQSSIVAGNLATGLPSDLDGSGGTALTVGGANNLIGVVSSRYVLPADTLRGDPLLLPLADNGGPTRTHALAATSPAIDRGNNNAGTAFDQRGASFVRQFGAGVDIGAFELQPTERIFADGFE